MSQRPFLPPLSFTPPVSLNLSQLAVIIIFRCLVDPDYAASYVCGSGADMNSSAQDPIPWLIRKWWRVPLFGFIFWSIGMGITLPVTYVLSKRGQTIEATI